MTNLAADLVAHRTTDKSSRSDGAKKQREMELGIVDREMKSVHQVKGVVADQAGQIEEFENMRATKIARQKATFLVGKAW